MSILFPHAYRHHLSYVEPFPHDSNPWAALALPLGILKASPYWGKKKTLEKIQLSLGDIRDTRVETELCGFRTRGQGPSSPPQLIGTIFSMLDLPSTWPNWQWPGESYQLHPVNSLIPHPTAKVSRSQEGAAGLGILCDFYWVASNSAVVPNLTLY